MDQRKAPKTLTRHTKHLIEVDVFQSSAGSVDLCLVQGSFWNHGCVEPDFHFTERIDTVDVWHGSIYVISQGV